jgi:hypothetical protein
MIFLCLFLLFYLLVIYGTYLYTINLLKLKFILNIKIKTKKPKTCGSNNVVTHGILLILLLAKGFIGYYHVDGVDRSFHIFYA